MLIIADENMPYAREWFAAYGEVQTLPGRGLDATIVREVDALLVRSVTRVDANLLRNSRVRFVGSATSGIEHIDTHYLQTQGIACASAPGCNATAVVEYVLSCLCALPGVFESLLAGGVVGIIGLGNVGARLTRRLQALNIRCVGYDPFLITKNGLPLTDLETVLNADVICCHAPLTTAGAHPTRHLLDAERLRRLRQGAVLINAGRGAVIDNAALLSVLRERDDLRIVLDVWEHEPALGLSLLDKVALGTPHIAGYSWDGKVAGTYAVLEVFCRFFQLPLPAYSSVVSKSSVYVPLQEKPMALIRSAIQSVYDVRRDDSEMRTRLSSCEKKDVAVVFDHLRKNYPQRREFAACEIENWTDFSAASQALLRQLGFAQG